MRGIEGEAGADLIVPCCTPPGLASVRGAIPVPRKRWQMCGIEAAKACKMGFFAG